MSTDRHVGVIGGGPAGLMAAERLVQAGCSVDLFDAMPSIGRKFLLAGIGGLNLTHAEALPDFVQRYGAEQDWVADWLQVFDPNALRQWCTELGIPTFVGSSGRVFPEAMKAAPLLRAWLQRLRRQGVRVHTRQRWQGWQEDGQSLIASAEGVQSWSFDALVLALGGASWPRLGSDASWVPVLRGLDVSVHDFQPANCGFDLDWSEHVQRYAGESLGSVVLQVVDANGGCQQRRGTLVVTHYGVEGSLVYALSRFIRERIERDGKVQVSLDLMPDRSLDDVMTAVVAPRGKKSLSSHLKNKLKLSPVKLALLYEYLPPEHRSDPVVVSRLLKALPLSCLRPRPVVEAISSAGGVTRDELDAHLMLKQRPGVFCAGEMLDWEAPTGGYLLTASFASGWVAGEGAARWLAAQL